MSLTAMIVTGCVIILGIYDLIAITFGGVGSSISRFLQRSALKHPVVAFSIGFVCGHIFGYMAPEPQNDTELRIEHNQSDTISTEKINRTD